MLNSLFFVFNWYDKVSGRVMREPRTSPLLIRVICLMWIAGAPLCSQAQTSLVSFDESLLDPKGNAFLGDVQFQPRDASARGFDQYIGGWLQILVAPGDYCVEFVSEVDGATWKEEWVIPNGVSSVTMEDVRVVASRCSDESAFGLPSLPPASSESNATLPVSIASVNTLGADLAALNYSLSSLTSKAAVLASQTSSVSNEVDAKQADLSTLSAKVSACVAALSSFIRATANIDAQLSTLEASTGALPSLLNASQSNVLKISQSLSPLNEGISKLSASLDTLKTGVDSLATQLGELTAQTLAKAVASDGTDIHVADQILAGTFDGQDRRFALPFPPQSLTQLHLFRNGLELNASTDFSLQGTSITFSNGVVPSSDDVIVVSYYY
jgi:hypothetical protein